MRSYPGVVLRRLSIDDGRVLLQLDDVELVCSESNGDRRRSLVRRLYSALRDRRKLDIVTDDQQMVLSVDRTR